MLETKQIGNLTELHCITSFYELGYKVSIPYGENSRYDFIADVNGRLLRIQVKSCKPSLDGSTVAFPCRSTRVNAQGCYHRLYTEKDIDYFCTYYENKCYLVPVKECSKQKVLRFNPPKKKQQEGVINYAKDYELSSQLRKMMKE